MPPFKAAPWSSGSTPSDVSDQVFFEVLAPSLRCARKSVGREGGRRKGRGTRRIFRERGTLIPTRSTTGRCAGEPAPPSRRCKRRGDKPRHQKKGFANVVVATG